MNDNIPLRFSLNCYLQQKHTAQCALTCAGFKIQKLKRAWKKVMVWLGSCVWLCDMRSSGMRYEECERFGNGFLLRAPPLNLDSLWPIVPTTTTSELMLNHTKGVYGYSSFCAFSLWHRLCTLHSYEFLKTRMQCKRKHFFFCRKMAFSHDELVIIS